MERIYRTKTEVNKMKRAELLEMLYEQDKFYFESVSGSDKNWSKEHSFENYCNSHRNFTVKDLREKAVTL